MRLETEKHEEQWERRQRLYEFEINQLEERARLESTEMEKLRKENEQLKKLREDERLKRSQEVEQHNNKGCVVAPQGVMLVVQDLIDTTRRMKEQLGQTLIKETNKNGDEGSNRDNEGNRSIARDTGDRPSREWIK